MSNAAITNNWDDADALDEAPPITDADMARAIHRVGLQPAPSKKINIAATKYLTKSIQKRTNLALIYSHRQRKSHDETMV